MLCSLLLVGFAYLQLAKSHSSTSSKSAFQISKSRPGAPPLCYQVPYHKGYKYHIVPLSSLALIFFINILLPGLSVLPGPQQVQWYLINICDLEDILLTYQILNLNNKKKKELGNILDPRSCDCSSRFWLWTMWIYSMLWSEHLYLPKIFVLKF